MNPKSFEQVMDLVLKQRADPRRDPDAFYRGMRLLGLDGAKNKLRNTIQLLKAFPKAVSRRMRAAFSHMSVAALIEVGLHNPIAVAIGGKQESELPLAIRLFEKLEASDLVLLDRLYGVQKIMFLLLDRVRRAGAHFPARARSNLNRRVLEVLDDGSALVELIWRDEHRQKHRMTVREVQGVVRGRQGKRTVVRLWTSLLDATQYPGLELLALYAQRWEVEVTIKELKIEMRGREYILSAQRPETAVQEVAALVLAMAVLVEVRCEAAERGEVGVLRIGFRQTLRLVRTLWLWLEVGRGIHTEKQVRALVERTLDRIAAGVTPVRRKRSCPRQVRQPVTSWPRLIRRQEWTSEFVYEMISHATAKS